MKHGVVVTHGLLRALLLLLTILVANVSLIVCDPVSLHSSVESVNSPVSVAPFTGRWQGVFEWPSGVDCNPGCAKNCTTLESYLTIVGGYSLSWTWYGRGGIYCQNQGVITNWTSSTMIVQMPPCANGGDPCLCDADGVEACLLYEAVPESSLKLAFFTYVQVNAKLVATSSNPSAIEACPLNMSPTCSISGNMWKYKVVGTLQAQA